MISHAITAIIFICWLNIDLFWKVNYNTLMSKFLVKIGDISFSIYLIHMLVINIIIDLFEIRNLYLVTVIAYSATIALSLLTFKFIETPFITLAKKLVTEQKIKISLHKNLT